jgi:uncharacterized protein YgbK (DUF1537 family)
MNECFIADDLSGALDAAGAFFRAGRSVTIALSPERWPEVPADEVIGFTTETRNASPDAARAAVQAVMHLLGSRGSRLVYKKIDSTLRGPIAAEVVALAECLPAARFLFCPANPAVGRTVRAGVLLVQDVPVAATEFGRDPVSPVRESNLRALLASIAGPRLVLADAADDSDLEAAVRAMESGAAPWVAIGSGALARPVASRLVRPVTRHARPAETAFPPGPVLFLCGSAHPINRVQASALAAAAGIPTHPLLPASPLPAVLAARRSLRERGGASLIVDSARIAPRVVLEALALAAAELMAEVGAGRIFLTGGETAQAVCRQLGIDTLRFVAELEPGVAVADSVAFGRQIRLAIKPGGFGSPEAWVGAWRRLK